MRGDQFLGSRLRVMMAWFAAVAATVPLVLLAPLQRSAFAADGAIPCAQFVIIGIRGSGQTADDFMNMGKTIAPYARAAQDNLVGQNVAFYNLPYTAAFPTSTSTYVSSVLNGENLLRDAILTLLNNCRNAKVGVIGYSQGSQVANKVLRGSPDVGGQNVWAALLLADPASAGDSMYDRHSDINGGPGTHTGWGVLDRSPLAPEYQHISTDFCITSDPVCDAPEKFDLGFVISAALFGIKLHSSYPDCCGTGANNFPAPQIFGRELAQRLLRAGLWEAPPAQCGASLAPPHLSRSSLGPEPRTVIGNSGGTGLLALAEHPGCRNPSVT